MTPESSPFGALIAVMAPLGLAGANNSSKNDLVESETFSAFNEFKFKYVLPMGAGKDDPIASREDVRRLSPILHSILPLSATRAPSSISVWGHRAGNPTQNPEDDDFIDRAVKELLRR